MNRGLFLCYNFRCKVMKLLKKEPSVRCLFYVIYSLLSSRHFPIPNRDNNDRSGLSIHSWPSSFHSPPRSPPICCAPCGPCLAWRLRANGFTPSWRARHSPGRHCGKHSGGLYRIRRLSSALTLAHQYHPV